MRPIGHLDAVTSSGFAEGWAYNLDAPLKSLTVAVLNDGEVICETLANSYRHDLANLGYGDGWCAFRGRLDVAPKVAHGLGLELIEITSGKLLHKPRALRFSEDSDPSITSLGQLLEADPTLLGPLERLTGCSGTFSAFIKHRGVEAFVRAAYVFMLGRPADHDGVSLYSRLIRQSKLDTVELMLTLAASDEFRGRARMLAAPNTAAFPFCLD